MGKSTIIHLINAATATASSGWIPTRGATSVQFVFQRSNHASGSTAFTVKVSPESTGTPGIAYSKLISNATNTNAQTLTRVASVSLGSDTASLVSMSQEDIGGFVQVTATETTDGTHDAWVILNYDD